METPPPLVNLSQQRCFNHTSREAVARCPECGRFFCRECITEHDDRVLCAVCLGKKGKTGFIRNIRLSADMIRVIHFFSGTLIIWIFFYYLARILLAIPVSFHDGTFLDGGW